MSLISAMIKTYKGNNLSQEEIKKVQQKRLKQLVKYVRNNSPYFNDLYVGISDEFSLEELPTTNKIEMMKNFDSWITDNNISMKKIEEFTSDIENVGRMIDGKYLIFKTSGSTGNPATVLYDKQNIDVASAVAAFRTFARKEDFKAFIKNGKKTAGVFANYGFYLACGMSRYLQLQMPRKKNKITVDVNASEEQIIKELKEFNPSMLSGYPSNLALLSNFEELTIKPNVVITGGELLTNEIRKKLTDKFNCYVQTHYSCTEVGEIACECSEKHLHINEDWVILEPVDLNQIISQLTKSEGGLYPHEILMLNIVSGYKTNCENNFEWFWKRDLGIDNPQALINNLINRGFVDVEDTKTAISRLTIPEIKEFLKEYDCKLSGNKPELLDRLFSECDVSAIGSTITQRRYCLTEKGKEEVEREENEYVMFTFRNGNGISIFEMNIMLYKNNPLNLSCKDIIWEKYVKQAEEKLQNLEFGPYRNSMWSMSRFLRDENKYDESLYYICKAAMYDISGLYCKSLEDTLENLEYMIKNEFPYSDVATRYGGGLYIYIAPGLVDYIRSMQRDMEAKGANFKEKVIKNLKEIKLAKEVFSTEEKIEIFFAELDEDYDKLEEIYSKLEKTMKDKYNKLMEETIKYFVEGEECDDDTKRFQMFKNGISLKRKLEEYEEDYDEESIKMLAEKLIFTDVETAEEDIEKTIELLKSMMATEEDYEEDDEEYYEDEEYDDEEEYYDEEEYNNIEKVCELFTSFDKERIIKYFIQNEIEIPEYEELFWVVVHKSICKLFLYEDSTIGTEQFNESFNWLTSRGYVPIEDEENDEIE